MRLRIIPSLLLLLCSLAAGMQHAKAALGLDREAYGVWDREGGHSVSLYPYTRGQEYQAEWTAINPARSNFNWAALDARAQLAYDQNQRFFVKIQPVSSTTVPPWMFSAGVPQINTSGLTYGYYLDPEFKLYFSEMVAALGKHLREELPVHLRNITSFVRCDTGATGDEGPYDPADLGQVPAQYQISDADWRDYRIWVFGLYDQAMQHGTGTTIPVIFQNVESPQFQIEQDWVKTNLLAGWGAKYGGQVRGHHLTESRNVPDSFKAYAMDTPMKFFSANEMDQTWEKFYFQLNVPLSFYWCAAESLNAGLSIQDWSGSALEGAAANGFEFAAVFFNLWAAELDPPTARGGFCIFHEGLDSANTNKFPVATYGSASKGNTARYTAICAAYAGQGAQMDDLTAATWGQVLQRRDQNGFNDAGWEIWPDNYERFITQISPDNTSLGVWRCRGVLNTSSHPFDRFGRRFDSATGRNTMYFDVNDGLTPTAGQSIQLSVVYLDSGTGQFALKYDAVGNSQKTAFTVTKANSNTWKTNSVVVTDWVFGNNGPNGADLMLANVDSNNDTFHSIELVKLGQVTVSTVGQGTVSGRNDGTVYSPVNGTFAQGLRLDLSVTPAPGWSFSGWTGDLSGTNSRPIIFAGNNTQITANFAFTGNYTSSDDFESGTWSGGTGWGGIWGVGGTATPGSVVQLNNVGQITRTLATPIPNATLSFAWDLDRIDLATESGTAEVYDGSWHTVWSWSDKGADAGSTPDLVTTNIDLSAYGSISIISFTLNGNASTDRFWIDNVVVNGSAGGNVAPVFTADPISKAAATEDAAYTGQTLAGSATDANGDTLTYSKVSGPAWLSVAANGALAGTPANADVGNNSWTVQVSDGLGGTDTAVLNITVANVNDAPVFTVDPMSKANATEDAAYTGQTLAGSATDVDAGATLTYSKVSGPNWLSVAADGTLSGTPANADVGNNSWTVQVSDGLGGTDTAVLNITVANVNDAPAFTVDPMSRADATAGTAYTGQTLAGSATDVDAGATLTYTKVSGPTWLSIAIGGALTGTPASTNAGVNSWTVQVSDGLGGTDTAVLNITVNGGAPQTLTNTFISVSGDDGWVNESAETSNAGGTMDATAGSTSALRIGDDGGRKQFKTVVSFDTSALPDGATIVSATIRLKRGASSNNTSGFGAINVDIIGGTGFGGNTALAIGDFEAAAGATGVATMTYPGNNGTWSTGSLNSAGLALVNKTGKTQLRVAFALDDDNDSKADYLGLYSGEAAAGNQPELVIVYQ